MVRVRTSNGSASAKRPCISYSEARLLSDTPPKTAQSLLHGGQPGHRSSDIEMLLAMFLAHQCEVLIGDWEGLGILALVIQLAQLTTQLVQGVRGLCLNERDAPKAPAARRAQRQRGATCYKRPRQVLCC